MILAYRFHDMKSTFTEILLSRIATQFHGGFARHLGEKNNLSFRHEVIEERTDVHLVRKRIISHNNLRILQTFPEACNNRKREFL